MRCLTSPSVDKLAPDIASTVPCNRVERAEAEAEKRRAKSNAQRAFFFFSCLPLTTQPEIQSCSSMCPRI